MKVRRSVVGTVAVCLLAVAGCCSPYPECRVEVPTSEVQEPATEELGFAMNYPRVDGSTSTHPLGVLIACELLGVPWGWEASPWDATKRVVPEATVAGKEHVAENIVRTVVHQGTHGSYVNLIGNSADVILVARLPSEDELELAESLGVESGGGGNCIGCLCLHPQQTQSRDRFDCRGDSGHLHG